MLIDQKDCIKEMTVYNIRKKDKSGGILTKALFGIPSKKKGYIHLSKDDGHAFEDKATKIPKNAKKFKRTKNRYSDDWAKSYFCKKPKTNSQLKKEKTIKKNLVGHYIL